MRNQSSAKRSMRFESLEDRRMLATLTVNSLSENIDLVPNNNGELTLREAIQYVNVDALAEPLDIESNGVVHIDGIPGLPGVVDKIVFDPALFASGDPTKATIELLHEDEPASSTALVISNDVIIEAPEGYEEGFLNLFD